jgi:hypothetical protein
MKNFTILVCLYEKDIKSSDTLKSLLENHMVLKDSNIYIWDNSVNVMVSSQLCFLNESFNNLTYTHTPENLTLAKIYNKIASNQINKNDYLILLDDDSILPVNFFQEIFSQTKKYNKINLFLPQIHTGDKLISPAKDFILKTAYFKKLEKGVLSSNQVTAINSGMIISNRVFLDGFRYDERLRFYGTDNYFMYNFSLKYSEIYVLDTIIHHDLSFESTKRLERKIQIFKEIKRANRIIYSNSFVKKNIVIFSNFISAIKLSFKNKTLSFFENYD